MDEVAAPVYSFHRTSFGDRAPTHSRQDSKLPRFVYSFCYLAPPLLQLQAIKAARTQMRSANQITSRKVVPRIQYLCADAVHS